MGQRHADEILNGGRSHIFTQQIKELSTVARFDTFVQSEHVVFVDVHIVDTLQIGIVQTYVKLVIRIKVDPTENWLVRSLKHQCMFVLCIYSFSGQTFRFIDCNSLLLVTTFSELCSLVNNALSSTS